jgi:uncharacterized RDD family membrane protein YckC
VNARGHALGRAADASPVVLTPEHVPIELVPAGLASRFVAHLADFAIITATSFAVQMLLRRVVPFGLGGAIAATTVFVLTWGYHVFFEVFRNGQSPGKRLMRLRVVDARGLPIAPPQAFVRNIVRVIDFMPFGYGLGALVALFDGHRRRLGDIAAGTFVIKEAKPLDYTRQLAQGRRFNSLRTPGAMRFIRRIGLEEREFLLTACVRAPFMEQKTRFDLMEAVGAHYKRVLQVEEMEISGENLVRDLTEILYGD